MADLSKNVWGTKSKSKWNVDDEEPEDILYPTMNGIKDEIKKQSSPFKSNAKKKTGGALGESIYDDDDDFKDLNIKKYDEDDKISEQIKPEKESNQKFEEAAEILYKYPIDKKSEKSDISDQETRLKDKDGILTGAAAKIEKNNDNILKQFNMDENKYQVNGNVISKKAKTKDYEEIDGIKYPRTVNNKKAEEMKAEAIRQRDLNNKAEREKYVKGGFGVLYSKGIDNINNPLFKNSGLETIVNLQMSKADSYMNTNYARKHKIYNTYKDAPAELQEYLKEKISNQIGKDKLETTKGIYVDKESNSSKSLAERLMKEKSFIELLKNYEKPMNNKFLINDSISFTDKNWHNAIGNADIRRMGIDKNGDVELYVTDTYDFNKDEKKGPAAVGRKKQEDGEIKPYFSIYHVVIPKEEKDKALKKY